MRIRILGDTDSAASVRGMINQDRSVSLSNIGYLYTVEIINGDFAYPTVDGVDSEWERKFINRIADCAKCDILLIRSCGVTSDQHIRIGIPDNDNKHLVERGVFQAILQMVNTNNYYAKVPGETTLWERFCLWLAAFPR